MLVRLNDLKRLSKQKCKITHFIHGRIFLKLGPANFIIAEKDPVYKTAHFYDFSPKTRQLYTTACVLDAKKDHENCGLVDV